VAITSSRFRPTLAVVAAAAVLVGCSDSGGSRGAAREPDRSTTADLATTTTDRPARTEGAPPVVPGATWQVDTPERHHMDDATLARARSYAFQDGKHTQGVVVVRDGAIVAEWYAPGADEQSWAASWSMAKSVTSALVGIAIDEGKIPGIEVPMTTYFPDWAQRGLGDVTLRDVLEMSSGLAWNESYSPSELATSDVIKMVVQSPDELAYAASRPKADPPGTRFNYTSGGSMLLSGVLQQATGDSVEEYAKQKLWSPLRASKVDMWSDAAGHTLTYCCVDTTSRDFARFGLLYLDRGRWGDRQVVPASWVERSVAGSRAAPDTYGLQWWLSDVDGVPHDMFSARGHDGQYIYVVPSLDLVVVRNGTYHKFDGPSVADPNLFGRYPSEGLVADLGTTPPDDWDDGAFLRPIVESIRG
jgi:CubicO group peptidase (beta-lactamase class C family)